MMLKKNTHQYFYRTFLLYFYFFLPTTPPPPPPHSRAVLIMEPWGFMRNESSQGGVARRYLAVPFGAHFRSMMSISRLCHLPASLARHISHPSPKIFCTSRFFNLSSLSQCYSQCFTNYHSAFEIS